MGSSIERSRRPLFAVQSFGGGAGSCSRFCFCFCLPSIFSLLALCADLLDSIASKGRLEKCYFCCMLLRCPFGARNDIGKLSPSTLAVNMIAANALSKINLRFRLLHWHEGRLTRHDYFPLVRFKKGLTWSVLETSS